MAKFKKIAELSPEDRNKVKNYWTQLWGKQYATDLTTDYKPEKLKTDKNGK